MTKLNIKVGDIVEVIDNGQQYNTYIEWIEREIESIHLRYMFDYGNDLDVDSEYEVIHIAQHNHLCNEILLYIQNTVTRKCYLISAIGVQKVGD